MDSATLDQKVRDAIHEKLAQNEPFTTADISHPIIQEDADVRHRHVKEIMEQMEADGDMQIAGFTISMITVYPNGPGTSGMPARLWHPIGFNPDDYKGNKKVLIRSSLPTIAQSQPGNQPALTSATMRPSFGIPSPVSLPAPTPVIPAVAKNTVASKSVAIQLVQKALNIPTKLVRAAGLHPGDPIEFFSIATGASGLIHGIRRAVAKARQKVDKEGRIRLYGKKARSVTLGQSKATVSVVDDNGSRFIGIA